MNHWTSWTIKNRSKVLRHCVCGAHTAFIYYCHFSYGLLISLFFISVFAFVFSANNCKFTQFKYMRLVKVYRKWCDLYPCIDFEVTHMHTYIRFSFYICRFFICGFFLSCPEISTVSMSRKMSTLNVWRTEYTVASTCTYNICICRL